MSPNSAAILFRKIVYHHFHSDLFPISTCQTATLLKPVTLHHNGWQRFSRQKECVSLVLALWKFHFPPEQEAQLSQIANYNGAPAEQLVKHAALRLVEEDVEIRAGIQRGIEQADRRVLIERPPRILNTSSGTSSRITPKRR